MATSECLVLVGNGGHAKVVLGVARSLGIRLAGIIAAEPAELDGLPHLGGDDAYPDLLADGTVAGFAFGIGSVSRATAERRARIFDRLAAAGGRAPALVHPTANLAEDIRIGAGSVIGRGAVVAEGVTVGRNVILNTAAVVDHDCIVGDHAHLAPGVVASGGVRIGRGVLVGVGARLVQNITIGDGAVVGAGAVVLADVPAGATVVGVPARIVG